MRRARLSSSPGRRPSAAIVLGGAALLVLLLRLFWPHGQGDIHDPLLDQLRRRVAHNALLVNALLQHIDAERQAVAPTAESDPDAWLSHPTGTSQDPVAGGERRAPWLRIVIPSHARRKKPGTAAGVNYLRPTLRALLEQMADDDPLRAVVDILVVSTDDEPELNVAFRAVRAELSTARGVRFVELAGARRFNLKPDMSDTTSPLAKRSKAGAKAVQQQTLDLAEVLTIVAEERPSPHLVLFMEDDWLICPHGLLALVYFVRKVNSVSREWTALRCSYGFNGIVIHSSDLTSLRNHFVANYTARPPDHLVFDWFMARAGGPGSDTALGPYRVFRHNLFYHIGVQSTLNQPSNRYTPRCYELMYDWLLPDEVFRRDECPDDDVWPCSKQGGGAYFERFPFVEWAPGALRDERGHVPKGKPIDSALDLAEIDDAAATAAATAGVQKAGATVRHVRTGALNEDCYVACSRFGERCDQAQLININTCDDLRAHFACKECTKSNGPDQPAYVAPTAAPEFLPGHCLINTIRPDEFNCGGRHSATQRLCPCVS